MAGYSTAAGKAFAYIVCLASLHAQTPDDSGRAVHFDANLVQVDAVVTDAHGAYIRDLKADDFRIQQDGKTRKVTAFSYVTDPAPAHTPRTIVFLINDGNMLALNMVRVRDALSRLVAGDLLQPGDQVALLTTMGGSEYLRQFLPAGPQLRDAIDDLRWRPAAPDPVVLAHNLELLRRTIVALAALPGRKSLIVLSNDMLGERFDLRSIADAASRASVVVHTIDPRPAEFIEPGDTFLPALAAITGGTVRRGGLDLDANLRAVMDDQAGYYLVGWDPGPALKQLWSWPVYHRLTLKTNRPGLIVRSRDGFFGVTGPVAPNASASKTQQILAALYTPLRPQEIPVRVTPLVRQRDNVSYVQALVHIGGGIELTKDTDDCYRANLTIYSSLHRLGGPDDPTLSIRGAGLRLCGPVAESVREKGVVAIIEEKVSMAGYYQVHVGVRNGTIDGDAAQAAHPNGLIRRADWKQEAARLATASEFLDVPDPSLGGTAFPALYLRGPRTVASSAGKTDFLFRTLAYGDPATRIFHSGDLLTYDAASQARFQIVRDGEVVDSGDATGNYRLKQSLAPGQYLLHETAADGASVSQWADFRIVN
jgi:Ca-activated chloride channel family protein